jgi:hypothetical protein
MNAQDISAGARTVAHTADYFEELKAKTAILGQRREAHDRGYFTPNEEDEVRGIFVSYWQVRNALLEMITSFRLDSELSEEDYPAAFLTAFAGALVLIDAAWFLRETVHDRALVREKLNEPAAQFGVPAGLYETVQRSLMSARNAWHLYHAMRYFEENQPQLRELARDGELRPVMEAVERLRHRLDITAAQFARARLRMRASQAYRSLVKGTLHQAMYGLQKMGGEMLSDRFVRRGHEPQLPAEIAARVRALLAPGDVLVVRKEYAVTNYFLPGYWPHAALYLGDAEALTRLGIHDQEHVRPRWRKLLGEAEERCRVLESMKDGVQIRTLASPFSSDSIVVLRPQLSPDQIAQGLARVMAHEGKPYDFDFDFRRSDRLVCTAVVYRAFDGIGAVQFPLVRRAGRPTLSGSDLIHMAIARRHFDPVAVFVPGGDLVQAEGATAILREKCGEPTVAVEKDPSD